MPIKGRSKTKKTRILSASSTKTIPLGERTWTDVEPGEYSISDYEMSKKLIHLLRHGGLLRENDGEIEFCSIKDNLQKHFVYCFHLSDDRRKKSMTGGGGNKKRYQYCSDSSGTIVYFRALQGHSGRSLIDPILQDKVIIPSGFFQYNYHVGCAFNLHSIISSGFNTWRSKFEQETDSVLFLPVDPMDKDHKDPDVIDLNVPRLAQYMHNAWKKHLNTVYWVDINFAVRKGLKFHQTRSNAIILYDTLPPVFPESHYGGNWRNLIRESICVNSTSSKDFLARASALIKQNKTERSNPLSAVTQGAIQGTNNQC